MDLLEIAELLDLHPSVIDNYYEEWQFQEKNNEEDYYEMPFKEYLCTKFAEHAFLSEAAKKYSNAMACLEAYDDEYQCIDGILTN